MARIISYARFSFLKASRIPFTPSSLESVNPYSRTCGVPSTRCTVVPFPGVKQCQAPDVRSVDGDVDSAGQPPVVGMYAGTMPLVGSLSQIQEALEDCHSKGIRCGLTRLRKGVWQLAPRSVMS